MNRLLSVEEVADLLGVRKSTIYAWVSEGYIPHCKVGKFLKFREKKIEEWIERNEIDGKTERTQIDTSSQIT